ncbi:ribonuclease H1 [Trichonephila clavipes]|nr:ribonuclease H1 [Trichonephila clavipes]
MFKVGTCAVFVLLFCLVKIAEGQKPPRAYAKAKCEKRIKNETQLEQCKMCVEQYNLPEYPSKSESVSHSYNNFKNTVYVRTKVKVKMPKPGFYAVRCGRKPGVYMTWSECEAQVKGFPNAAYKKFPDRSSAENFAGVSSINQDSVQNAKNRSENQMQRLITSNAIVRNYDPIPSTSMSIEEAFENTPDLIFNFSDKPQKPYYAVHRGARPGVYRTWTECEAQIKNTRNASYRKFDNEEQALEYVRTGGIVKATKRELNDIIYSNHVIKKLKRNNSNEETEYVLQNPNETVVVFTDGASAENGRKRARAGIGIYWGHNHPLNTSKRLTGRQTNNRAEIQAAVYALNQAKQIGARKVKLYTDSQFLIHAITDWIRKWKTNGWKLVNGTPVVNKEDFLELEAVSKGLDVEWVYVKAHARNHGNDEADRLAVAGARLLMEPSNCSTFPKPEIESRNVEPFILTDASSSSDILPLIIPEGEVERKTFYAVHKGKCPGVYKTWTECEKQIKDFVKPWFKKFSSEDEALEFVKNGKVSKAVTVPDHGPDKFVTVFTDGASSCNGQEEARAGIGVYWGPGNQLNTSMRLPGRQTNNRAEIFAAVHALRQAKKLGIKNLRLYTDSQFVIKGITTWIDKWKENNWTSASGKPVINKDDFMALDNARQNINVDWCYVKGHSNNPGNVEADKLAVDGCSKSVSDSFILT